MGEFGPSAAAREAAAAFEAKKAREARTQKVTEEFDRIMVKSVGEMTPDEAMKKAEFIVKSKEELEEQKAELAEKKAREARARFETPAPSEPATPEQAHAQKVTEEFDRIIVEASLKNEPMTPEKAMRLAEFKVGSREEAEEIEVSEEGKSERGKVVNG